MMLKILNILKNGFKPTTSCSTGGHLVAARWLHPPRRTHSSRRNGTPTGGFVARAGPEEATGAPERSGTTPRMQQPTGVVEFPERDPVREGGTQRPRVDGEAGVVAPEDPVHRPA